MPRVSFTLPEHREHPWLKAPFHSIRRLDRPDRTQVAFDLTSDPGSEDPFSLQTNPSDAPSWFTLEPINGAEAVPPETATIFAHNFKRKSIWYSILSLQVASLPSATSFDWLMSSTSNADRTHFVSGRQTLGRLTASGANRNRPFSLHS